MRNKNVSKIRPFPKKAALRSRKTSASGKTSEASINSQADVFADYTPAQWAIIETCVAALPKAPLTDRHRRYLRDAAKYYESNLAVRERGNYVSPSMKLRSWRKVAQSAKVLRANLEAMDQNNRSQYGNDCRAEPVTYLSEDLSHQIIAIVLGVIEPELDQRLKEAGVTLKPIAEPAQPVKRNLWITVDVLLGLLAELESFAKTRADPNWRVSLRHSVTGRLDPSVVYFQQALSLWTSLGGRLKFSRDLHGEPVGPLVNYFRAVISPVMRGKAPSVHSIPDIVKRQKAVVKKVGPGLPLAVGISYQMHSRIS
jgi:hypothetical protein